MVDHRALGAEGAPFDMDLERGKVREFALATGADLADYTSGDAPPIPPTFLTTQFFWEAATPGADPWPLVQMSQERGMHAEQEYVFHGPPPRAGTRLRASSRIARIETKPGRSGGALTFVEKVTRFVDAEGRLVAESRLVGVETERAPQPGGTP